MAKKAEDESQQLEVHVSSEMKKGVYCNLAGFHHTANEFILDFVFAHMDEGELVSRVITNPTHAKAILFALEDNVKKYESKYGEIEEVEMSIEVPDLIH